MIPGLPTKKVPDWLAGLKTVECTLPIHDILTRSLYYPASGTDGNPIKYLGGYIHSFVYADYGLERDEVRSLLKDTSAFEGYTLFGLREVSKDEFIPPDWTFEIPKAPREDPRGYLKYKNLLKYSNQTDWGDFSKKKGTPPKSGYYKKYHQSGGRGAFKEEPLPVSRLWAKYQTQDNKDEFFALLSSFLKKKACFDELPEESLPERAKINPFAFWAVYERNDELGDDHGPKRFSLLFVGGEGVSMFQALYYGHHITPNIISIIQSGMGFIGGWTDFRDERKMFVRSVLANGAGQPKYLLCGGVGPSWRYRRSCWKQYSDLACFWRSGRATLGLWKRSKK